MLKNEYLDAKIGVDPAENEPSKVAIDVELTGCSGDRAVYAGDPRPVRRLHSYPRTGRRQMEPG